jgi:hypothetical protein
MPNRAHMTPGHQSNLGLKNCCPVIGCVRVAIAEPNNLLFASRHDHLPGSLPLDYDS